MFHVPVLLVTASALVPVTREQSADAVLHAPPGHVAVAPPPAVGAAPDVELTHAVYGYYPSWTGDDFSEMRFDLLTHVAYFTGGCTASGGYSAGSWPFDELVTAAHAHDTRVVLVVPCFGAAKIDAVFANRTAFIQSVVAAVSSGALAADGVDLDFEGMSASHLGDFPGFAAELAAAVRAVVPDAEISAALPAVDWSSAYDYAALADVLDHLVIMGYGYHWSGGNPGPLSPLDYAGDPWTGYTYDLAWSVDDYLDALPDPATHSKVLLGLPYYGYDWPSTDFSVPGTKSANGTSRTYAAAMTLSSGLHVTDAASQTNSFFYEVSGEPHQLWFDDAATLSTKYDAAKGYGLGGIAIWALQYDRGHTELWDAIEVAFAATPAPSPTPEATPSSVDPPEPVWRELGESSTQPGSCSVAGASGGPFAACLALLAAAASLARRRR